MTAKNTIQRTSRQDHYVVAIGASAGGLEAIHEFFDNMPETKSLSFVIIQHLSPDYKSLLVDLVSRHTHMKVYEAANDTKIERNCIYVIPNNKFITVKEYRLVLTEKLPLTFPNNAIDVFMQSLASELKSQGIAIILSGTGTDGSKGIKLVKEAGGMVIVQEPSSSKFDGMPNSAITTGNVDFILSPKEIPQQILSHLSDREWSDSEDTFDDETLEEIFTQLHEQAGIDLHYYKTPTISRRLFHRMRKADFSKIRDYSNFLKHNPEECRLLGKDLLINVTRFFRDTEAYKVLGDVVIPDLIASRKTVDQCKVWICACSTGEEAYSMAILVDEILQQKQLTGISFKFFASDIEQSNIEIAGRGFYPRTIEADVSKERLATYFTKTENGYSIIPRIRKQIVFALHNVLKDPPFIKNDLVTCRNMLIYMNGALQERVYSLLLFALKLDGHLFLGPTENPNSIKSFIQEIDPKWKVFKKIAETKVAPVLAGIAPFHVKDNGHLSVQHGKQSGNEPSGIWEDLRKTLFNDFDFAAFHIDRTFEIKEAIGNFDRILSLPKKVLKLNLVRMLPGDISTSLVSAIKAAWKNSERRTVRNVHHRNDAKDFLLQVVIQPDDSTSGRFYTTVAFQFVEIEEQVSVPLEKPTSSNSTQAEYVLSLEEELYETRGNLQHAVEDLQTANEELQSSNEELLSSNEELQSTNEELQSLNEELHTLNTEHQLKIRELIELNDDLSNYFRGSDIGQIFLDRSMVIRKFNPASVRLINLIDSDIGRPITHISTNVRYAELIDDIIRVQRTGETFEKEVQLHSGLNILLRIIPYITREKETSGVVISFFDITTVTNLNNIIRGVFNSSLSSIFALRSVRDNRRQIVDFVIETANDAASKLLNRPAELLAGMSFMGDIKASFLESLIPQFVNVVEDDQPLHIDHYDETAKRWFEITAIKMTDGLVVTFSDVTQKKNAETNLKKNYSELISAKENLKKLNSELEDKVKVRTQLLSESEERFRMVARGTNDVIWDWDVVNNKIWASDAYRTRLGYDATEDLTRQAWVEKFHPDDRADISQSIYAAINSAKSQWTKEYRLRKANGEYCNILDRAYIMHDENGTPYRVLGSMLDVTELKNAELEIANNIAQRKFLAESMPLIVLITTRDGFANFVNKQFEIYTGLNSNEALHAGWKSIVWPEELARLEQQWEKAIDLKSDFQIELRLRLSDHRYHWNILSAKAQKDEYNNIINWVITAIDIEDQKRVHELLEQRVEERTKELKKMNYALEVSNNDLQQFASVASHDLQEPLRKIHMYSNMIKERYGNMLDGGTQYIEKILSSTTRMKSVIHNILNYSKLSADNPSFITTNVNSLINEITEDLELLVLEKKAIINVDELPLLDIIPGQIRQVFQNMIGNALKFTRAGVPPVINITSDRTDQADTAAPFVTNGNFCRIFIKDNGIGFDKKFAQSIFVLFQRLHSKDVYDGTGIGLAIAKKIIEKHNGSISAASIEGEGSTFIIILPIHHNTES